MAIIALQSPRGIIYRSKVKIKKDTEVLKLSTRDLRLLLDFKPDSNEEPRKDIRSRVVGSE